MSFFSGILCKTADAVEPVKVVATPAPARDYKLEAIQSVQKVVTAFLAEHFGKSSMTKIAHADYLIVADDEAKVVYVAPKDVTKWVENRPIFGRLNAALCELADASVTHVAQAIADHFQGVVHDNNWHTIRIVFPPGNNSSTQAFFGTIEYAYEYYMKWCSGPKYQVQLRYTRDKDLNYKLIGNC